MNENTKRAIFLDFDGVLFDTVKEAYCVAMMALGKTSGIINTDMNSSHFREFYRLRFLVGPAWNYYYLLPLVDKRIDSPSLDIASDFRGLVRNSDPRVHNAFEEKFFNTRSALIETDTDNWFSLITPYAFLNDLQTLMKDHAEKFFLISTRDRSSVLRILRAHHIGFLEGSIFGKEEYELSNSKKDIVQRLIDCHQIKESLFIDDLEEHIMACGTIENLYSVQARWGYVAPEKKEDNSARVIQYVENFIQGKNVWH
jgi:hypothetical protein